MLLRTLGGLALSGAGIHRPKPLLLLAYLSMEGPKDRGFLAELFWMNAAAPRQSLSVALSQLREGAPGAVTGDGTRLSSQVECDAHALLEAAAGGRWLEVLSLYSGPFLGGVEFTDCGVELEEWIFGTREYLATRVQEALIATGERCAEKGDLQEATRLGERAYALHAGGAGLDEELLARLYLVLAKVRSPRAREVRDEIDSLGIDLSPIMRAEGPALSSPPAESQARTRPATRGTHDLPNLGTPFVGRTVELNELGRLLQGEARLLTIVGWGGMGKTRLALALARQQLERSACERAYFVPLETVLDPLEIPTRIAAVMGLALTRGSRPLDVVMRDVANDHVLLILDNFEQLAKDARVTLDLLRACGNLRLVVTSREPLGLAEEFLYPIEGLAMPESTVGALERAAYFDALQLFVQRAKRSSPTFALTSENVEDVVGITRIVDGSPLGIELAAVLLRTLPTGEVLAELEGNLDVLAARERDTPDRHANLGAVFEQTWRLLPEPQQEALRGIAVFRGGFTRQAAAEVTGASIPVLAALMDRSLIRRRGGRFDLHPLVRQYAEEKLVEEPGAVDVLRQRHAEYFASFLEARRRFDRVLGQRRAFDEIAADLQNVRAAWGWAVASNREDLLERMAYMLGRFFDDRGMVRELGVMVDAALARIRVDSLAAAHLLFVKGCSLDPTDDRAHGIFQDALELCRRYGRDDDVAEGLHWLGVTTAHRKDAEGAIALWREALSLFRRVANEHRVVSCLNNLSVLTEDARENVALLEEAIGHCRRVGNALDLTMQLKNLAIVAGKTHGDYRRALTLMEEATALERSEGGRSYRVVSMLATTGSFLLDSGDPAATERHLREAAGLLDDQDHWEVEGALADLASTQALLHYVRGDITAARTVAEPYARIDLPSTELLVRLHLDRGDRDAAELILHDFQAHGREPVGARDSLHWRGLLHLLLAELAQDDPDEAAKHLLQTLKIATRFTFVPLALDALVTAHSLFPGHAPWELVEIAAAHPASTCMTRKRAMRQAPGSRDGRDDVPLRADALLTLAVELEKRLEDGNEAG